MQVVDIDEARTRLSELIALAVSGEPFVIAKAGKALAKVEAIATSALPPKRRLGDLDGKFTVPDDIKTPFADDIEQMFYGSRPDE